MNNQQCNILIIGAGICALTIARELVAQGVEDITIIEKEKELALHSSGRNSGVLHAGIYYRSGSLKAKLSVEGGRLMKDYCRSKQLQLLNCGKVIVAKDQSEIKKVKELYENAQRNGVDCRLVNEEELSKIEPSARTCQIALYSPETSIVDPIEIMNQLRADLESSGKVTFYFDTKLLSFENNNAALTSKGKFTFKRFINAAGGGALSIAQKRGLAKEYKSLPFLGFYKKLSRKSKLKVNGNIYPVPPKDAFFLGVHFTRGVDNNIYIGPTAIPVAHNEAYRFRNIFSFKALPVLYRDAILFLSSKDFRAHAAIEFKKYSTRNFYRDSKKLVSHLEPNELQTSNKRGIRAQLINWQTKELEHDFVMLLDDNSLHLVNTVSPGFTSSMAIAKYVVERLG